MAGITDGMISILTSVAGGAISSGTITYVLGARRAEREVRRAKLEALFAELSRDMRRMYISGNRLANEVRLLERGKKPEDDEDLYALELGVSDKYYTIINIYFPAVVAAYEQYFSAWQAVNSINSRVVVQIACDNAIDGHPSSEIEEKLRELSSLGRQVHAALLYEADRLNTPIWKRAFLRPRNNPHY